jgi:xanthine dehydrogenase accessory factor
MSFDHAHIKHCLSQHQKLVRVVVAATKGSTPRETGAAMLVWAGGQSGTIGGGALEFQAAARAREMLASDQKNQLDRVALGPDTGQCCGGAVTLLSEVYDLETFDKIPSHGLFIRAIDPASDRQEMPLALHRLINRYRSTGQSPAPELSHGYMIEPIAPPALPLWIYGAGHVGRALVNVLSPLPDFAITWLDVGYGAFSRTKRPRKRHASRRQKPARCRKTRARSCASPDPDL